VREVAAAYARLFKQSVCVGADAAKASVQRAAAPRGRRARHTLSGVDAVTQFRETLVAAGLPEATVDIVCAAYEARRDSIVEANKRLAAAVSPQHLTDFDWSMRVRAVNCGAPQSVVPRLRAQRGGAV
jgi:hypothetical protein